MESSKYYVAESIAFSPPLSLFLRLATNKEDVLRHSYPKAGQTVTVHYTGYLIDGSQWDSSRDRGKPFKFKLGAEQVIPGLDDGISQLSIGERAKIIIPPALGYGSKGFPGLIPPNSTLIFDVELVTFN